MSIPATKYRIVGLEVSNIKRIRAVQILPQGNVVSIGGKNDQGKSSLLDAILYAMAGNANVCEQPIRRGASKGDITVDLGDMIITKSFASASAPKLKVTMKDGTPVSSPQTILDALCSKISYDPMEWLRMKPEKQSELLRQLVGVDFSQLNQQISKAYDDRTAVNRDLTQKKSRLAAMPHHADAPAEEVSVKALMAELEGIRKINSDNEKVHEEFNRLNNDYSAKQNLVKDSLKEIQDLTDLLKKKTSEHNKLAEQLVSAEALRDSAKIKSDGLTEADETPIKQKIESADTINSNVRDNQARAKLLAEIAELEKTSNARTNEIEKFEEAKQTMLKEAKFPLPGLSFDDSGVLLDSVPFEQAGMAKKILSSVAIGIALHPKLRVILIRDGSLLDDDSMKLLTDMAAKEDFQVWVEIVGEGKASVVIEDGEVKEVA